MVKHVLRKTAGLSAALILAAGIFTGCGYDLDVTANAADGANARSASFSSSGDRIYATAVSAPASDRLQFKLKCASTIPEGTEFTFYTTYNNYSKFPSGTSIIVRDGAADPYTKWTTTVGVYGENTGNDVIDGWYPVTVKTKNATKEIGFTYNGTFAKGSVIAIKNISIALSFAESDWKRFETNTEFKFTEKKPDEFIVSPGNPVVDNPDPDPLPGNLPVMHADKKKTYTLSKDEAGMKVDELSGLTLSFDKKYLIGNIDGGYLYKISFDGKVSKFGKKDGYEGRDMEGLAMNPSNGDIYVCGEPNYFFKLTNSSGYESYSSKYKISNSITNGFDSNWGFEGIAWHKGNLYLGAQDNAYLFEVSTDGKVIQNGRSLTKVYKNIYEVGDLEYDPEHDWLWVLDSQKKDKDRSKDPFTIFLLNGDATKLLAKYYIGDFAKSNPEAICVDKEHGCIWVGEDDDVAKLHKIPFDNL